MFEVIITKRELYDKCENIEQLYDKFYYPLLVEYKELKKQVEELSKNYNLDIPGIYIVSRNDEIIRLDKKALQYLRSLEQKNYKLENQQKEFIKYLEDEINKLVKEYGNYVYDDYSEEKGKYDSYQEILQEYKEIIGVSDENRK